jgi:anthranilate synthase component 1
VSEHNEYLHAIDALRTADSAIVYESWEQSRAVVSGDARVLALRPTVSDAFRALDDLLVRWAELTVSHDAADARLAFHVGYEAQARAFAEGLPLPDAAFPEVCVLVPRSLSIIDTDTQSVRALRLPWSDSLLCEDFELLDATRAVPAGRRDRGSTTREEYLRRVTEIKDLIGRSDLEQAVVSMTRTFRDFPPVEDLYVALRRVNPSPQMFLIKGPGFALAGSSPLRMFELRGRQLTVETDGGTRPVSDGDASGSGWVPTEKEINEHELLVAALHDDIRPLVEPGSMAPGGSLIERRFSHVRHLFASVNGTLRETVTPCSLLRGMSPHGAVTGAPRIGAIEAIARVEETPRGPYGGVVGVVGPGTDMDVACVIRSFVVADDILSVQTGAGIVALSDPEAEYQECLDKAQALIDVLESLGSCR